MKFKPVKQINWMEVSGLLVGVFFTVAIMVFALVLYTKLFTSGMIGVEEYHLHSTFEKALGLRPGTRVQISGVDVGQISDMEIKDNGVYMEFTLRKQFQSWITDSATVYAIRDQNLISARVVTIEARKGVGRILEDGDFLPPGRAQDIETVLETANELLGRVNLLIDAADTLVAMAMDTGTTVGALFGSRALYDNLNTQLHRLNDITLAGKNALFKTSSLLGIRHDDRTQAAARQGRQPDGQRGRHDGQDRRDNGQGRRTPEGSGPGNHRTFGLHGIDRTDFAERRRPDDRHFEHVDYPQVHA